MKAAKEYKEHWEEVNFLRLLHLAIEIHRTLNKYLKRAIVIFNVLLYIVYQAAKGLFLIIKLLLLTEPSLNRIERDETWIFRHIK